MLAERLSRRLVACRSRRGDAARKCEQGLGRLSRLHQPVQRAERHVGFEAASLAAAADWPARGNAHMPEFAAHAEGAPEQAAIEDDGAATAAAKLEVENAVPVQFRAQVDLAEGRSVGIVLNRHRHGQPRFGQGSEIRRRASRGWAGGRRIRLSAPDLGPLARPLRCLCRPRGRATASSAATRRSAGSRPARCLGATSCSTCATTSSARSRSANRMIPIPISTPRK